MDGMTLYCYEDIFNFYNTYGYSNMPEELISDFAKLVLGATQMVWVSQSTLDDIANKNKLYE